MKTKAQLRKIKYKEQLHDNYIRNLLRSKGLMNYQITQKMIDDKRASVKLKREKEEFDKWRHFEKGEEPVIGQRCTFVPLVGNIYIGFYIGGCCFEACNTEYIYNSIAWQPAPTYKPE